MSESKIRRTLVLATALSFGALGSGAASAADKGVQTSFAQPLAAVHKAAVDALTVIGVTITKDEPTAIEGKREHKMGVFVGSGGETVTVTLSEADGKVAVDVRTSKSFVGMAGQKNWDQPVVDEMTKTLAAPAAPADAAATPAATQQ